MVGAGPRDPPRQDLRALGNELLQELDVLVIDVVDLVGAELTDLAPAEENLSRACHGSSLPFLGRGVRRRDLPLLFSSGGRGSGAATRRRAAGGPLQVFVR